MADLTFNPRTYRSLNYLPICAKLDIILNRLDYLVFILFCSSCNLILVLSANSPSPIRVSVTTPTCDTGFSQLKYCSEYSIILAAFVKTDSRS